MHSIASWPQFAEDEIDAALEVLRSGRVNYWTGEQGRRFEEEFATYCGVRYAIAVANGTVGLDSALRALGIGPGDDVIVTPRTFIASASSVELLGANAVFADIDRDSQNISAATIRAALTPATKAIICVHLNGWPCEMPAIMELAAAEGLAVVEDCAQAHGARIDERAVGSWGDVGVYSFCQDKIMSTGGEGGMVVTNREDLWGQMWSFKDHGKNYAAVHSDNHPDGFRWLHSTFGTNYRLTEMQSAIGRKQLRKLDNWVAQRRANAAVVDKVFADVRGVRTVLPPPDVYHAYYKHYLFVKTDELAEGWSRDRILQSMKEAGLPALSGSCPEVYLEQAFSAADLPRLPVAQELGESSIQLLVHPTLTEQDMEAICVRLLDIMKKAASS